MKVLENTPAVLSLGKLCDENGYSYEWINGQKPHLIKNGIRIQCNTENFVLVVVPGLSASSSSGSDQLASRTLSRQERDGSTSFSSSSSSPTTTTSSDSETRERERGSRNLAKSCADLSCNHRKSTSHRSEMNGIAERAVRRIKEGTSAVPLQSGLDEQWWADSMECYCNLRNVQDLVADGKTPYERRFGEPFKGPIIPIGAMVEFHPISTRDEPEGVQLNRQNQKRKNFWSIQGDFICRHHSEPRVQLYGPKEETFTIPLKYSDVTRATRTNLDLLLQKRMDYWNVDVDQILGKDSRSSLY